MSNKTTDVNIEFIILACFAKKIRSRKYLVRDQDRIRLQSKDIAIYTTERHWNVVSSDRANLRRIYSDIQKVVTFVPNTGIFELHPNALVGSDNDQITMSLANWLGVHLDRYDPDIIRAANLTDIAAGQL